MGNTTKYDVEAATVERLLVPESVSLTIPPFQRKYSWGAEEVSELLGDLFDDDDWSRANGYDAPYFLGSVVLAGNQDSYLVLDGQQRLTTISLLLAVLKQKLEMSGHNDTNEINKYLVSGKFGMKKTAKIRLQPDDNETYLSLLNNPSNAKEKNLRRSTLASAVHKINDIIDDYADKFAQRDIQLIEAYELMASRVMYNVEFVRIVAPTEGEAFRLFETLNDRGLALNAADLIKNKLFSQCGTDRIKDVIEIWRDVIEFVGDTEIVSFLRYFWIAFRGSIRKRGLYDAYRDAIDKMTPSDAFNFAEEIKVAAESYQNIINPDASSCPWGSDAGESLERLSIFRARSCRPVLLTCAQYCREIMPFLAKACESITVRYSMVAELNPNQLEKSYGRLCVQIRQTAQMSENNLDRMLKELFPEVPNDERFMQMFSQIELLNISNAWRQILIRINDFVGTGETRIEGPKKVHIEHIFPKNPSSKAYQEADILPSDQTNYAAMIGNLTLLSGRKNRSISNGPFSMKRSAYALSEIALNQWIANEESWSVSQILLRSKEMAKIARKAWPWPMLSND